MQFGSSGLPAIGPSSLTGTGLQFRISNNIALYEADLADTFNMFESPFLYASDTTRRIIIPTNDSMMAKFSTDGIWVKGSDVEKGEQQYYTGIVPVRLPLKAVSGAMPVDSAFVLVNDTAGVGDPVGTVVGGVGRSVLRVYEISPLEQDTLKNTIDPANMLHRQTRRIECDTNYFKDATFAFKLEATVEDTGKMWLKDQTEHGITLVDTSITLDEVNLAVMKFVYFQNKKVTTAVFQEKFRSRIIALPEGSQKLNSFDGKAFVRISVDKFDLATQNKFLTSFLRENGTFGFGGKGRLKVHTSGQLGISDIVWDSRGNGYGAMDWEKFKEDILNREHVVSNDLWLEFKYVPDERDEFYVRYQHNDELTWMKEERVELDIGHEYNIRFKSIYNTVSSLCSCKTGNDYTECLDEARKITEAYFNVWSKLAMSDESWGIKKGPCKCQIKTTGGNDISSGWLCYQWAYSVNAVLQSLHLNHFQVQRSAFMWYQPDDPATPEKEEDGEVYHNWVTIFTCNPSEGRSTNNGIHLDPWIDIKIGAFTAQAHKNLLLTVIPSPINNGNRNFYSTGSYPKEWLIGTYIDTDGIMYNISKESFGDYNAW